MVHSERSVGCSIVYRTLPCQVSHREGGHRSTRATTPLRSCGNGEGFRAGRNTGLQQSLLDPTPVEGNQSVLASIRVPDPHVMECRLALPEVGPSRINKGVSSSSNSGEDNAADMRATKGAS